MQNRVSGKRLGEGSWALTIERAGFTFLVAEKLLAKRRLCTHQNEFGNQNVFRLWKIFGQLSQSTRV